jgi:hypothetical protein
VCQSIKSTSLRDASVDFAIPHMGQLFCTHIENDWGHELSGLVRGYDQNVLIASVLITFQTGLLYYSQPFHCSISVRCLGLDCKVEYTDAIHGIMPESNNLRVQYTDSDLDHIFQHRVSYFPLLYFSWTQPN